MQEILPADWPDLAVAEGTSHGHRGEVFPAGLHVAIGLAIEPLAAAQAGAFTTAQAHAAGLPSDAIRRQLSAGRWTSPHRGVYLTGPTPADLAARMWAAHLALGRRSVVGGASAARYWGLTDEDPSPADAITLDISQPPEALVEEVLRRIA